MPKKSKPEKVVHEIRRQTRKHYSAEGKFHIVSEGLRGEQSIAELCRHEGIITNQNPTKKGSCNGYFKYRGSDQ